MSKESLERATAKLVQQVKDCGQSIIHNAESIVGNYDYQTDLSIHITIPMHGAMPEIDVGTTFIPEDCLDINYVSDDGIRDNIVRKINEEVEAMENLEIDVAKVAKRAAEYLSKELERMSDDQHIRPQGQHRSNRPRGVCAVGTGHRLRGRFGAHADTHIFHRGPDR